MKEYNEKLKSCTYCHINYTSLANSHNDEKCYILQLERRDKSNEDYLERECERSRKDREVPKSKIANVVAKTEKAKR